MGELLTMFFNLSKVVKLLRALVFFLVIILVGCNAPASKDVNSRLAADVNGVEITQREVDYFYERYATPKMGTKESFNLRRTILGDLVRTELLAQKARKMSLEKTPDYAILLYNAKKKVLADLAKEKLPGTSLKYKPEVINSVIQNNPRLFKERKLFVYDEVMIPVAESKLIDSLGKGIVGGMTFSDLLIDLKKQDISYNRTIKSVTSDQIPAELVAVLEKIKIGIPQLIRTGDNHLFIVELHDRLNTPIEGKAAIVMAKSMLMSRDRRKAVSKEMTALINESTIEYYGDYAKNTFADGEDLQSLPRPDFREVAKKKYKGYVLAGIFSGAILFAVMALTAIMRIIKGQLWLPRLWPLTKSNDDESNLYEIPVEVSAALKMFLLTIGVVMTIFLAIDVLTLLRHIPVWAILLSTVGGGLIGVGASQIFSWNPIANRSDIVYLIIAIVLTVPVFLSYFMIARIGII